MKQHDTDTLRNIIQLYPQLQTVISSMNMLQVQAHQRASANALLTASREQLYHIKRQIQYDHTESVSIRPVTACLGDIDTASQIDPSVISFFHIQILSLMASPRSELRNTAYQLTLR